MSLSKELVKLALKMKERGLSDSLLQKGKLHIIDTIGIAYTSYRGSSIAMKSIEGMTMGVNSGVGGVIGSEQKLPPAFAAFANTALAHAMDFDDIHDAARIHPTPVMLAAALAAGDVTEKKQIGLVEAVVIGNEVVCRLGNALEPRGIAADANWFLSQLFGYIGAAITTGLVIGLNEEQLVHAVGLAYMQAAGGKEAGVGVGSEARAIYPAFASMGGVQAALLASKGVTAPETSLDGRTGLFPIYLNGNLDERQRQTLLDDAVSIFEDTAIKLFPSCRYSHPYVNAVLQIRDEVQVATIQNVKIIVNSTAAVLCEPLVERIRPTTIQDAKFSIPFLVAFTFIYGKPTLMNFTTDTLQDERVLELAKLISVEQLQEDGIGIPIGEIDVITGEENIKVKQVLSRKVSLKDVKEKFISCFEFAQLQDANEYFNKWMIELSFESFQQLPPAD